MRKYEEVLRDSQSSIELVASTRAENDMNMDFMPAEAARVSHGSSYTEHSPEKNERLMEYLAEHGHMTPFEHQSATFRVVAPLFVAREWMRHRTQAYNEVSMRYTSNIIGHLYSPESWRVPHKTNRQGSAGALPSDVEAEAWAHLHTAYDAAMTAYAHLLELGVAKELARLVVPVGHYTQFYATASMRNWAAFCKLRCAPNAQYEIRAYAHRVDNILTDLWGAAWAPLRTWE